METKTEIWKDIKGFEGRYQVSNLGRVRYPDTWITRSYSNGTIANICIRKTGILIPNTNRTYYRVYLYKSKDTPVKSYFVHELVAKYFIDDYEEGMEIEHRDGNVSNNTVYNLKCYWPDSIPGEIWKPIEGYNDLYEVSNIGRVRSKYRCGEKKYINGSIKTYQRRGTILKPHLCNGYYCVSLYDGTQEHTTGIHRLVAKYFCDGYKEGLVVNHKDENRLNNRADNLEWCTIQYNSNYGSAIEKVTKSKMVKVGMYDDQWNLISTFESIQDAAKQTGHNRNSIAKWCSGTVKCSFHYKWKFL